MRSRLLVVVVILGLAGGYLYFQKGQSEPLQVKSPVASNEPTATPTPIQYHYDKNTNLKTELESVNPQVNSDDFTQVKSVISSITFSRAAN